LRQRIQAIRPDLEIEQLEINEEGLVNDLEWVLLGLETGERFWFTAHLGGARDVLA
jgi:hypothetical protein